MNNDRTAWYVVIAIAVFLLFGILIQILVLDNRTAPNIDDEQFATENKEIDEDSTVKESKKTVSAGDHEAGLALYENNCLACHGKQGASDHNGTNLQTSPVAEDFDAVIQQIKQGGTTMPAFEDDLSEKEIRDIAAYLTEVVAPLHD